MNLDELRTCARAYAGPEGPERVSGEIDEIAGVDFVEVLGWNAYS